jgi:site-specific recombinase XerD
MRTYGEHLHDWFDSLEQSGIAWDAVGEQEIALWRNRMLERPSAHTGRPYARSTINDRVRTVCRLYAHAHHRGWIDELPFHYIDAHAAWPARDAGPSGRSPRDRRQCPDRLRA